MREDEDNAEFQDIIKYEPEPMIIIIDDETNNLLWDLNHSIIIGILRQGPMTLTEIVARYEEEIAKRNEDKDEKDDEYIKPKSSMTIYRYLKALEKAKLVTEAGRRVYLKKTTTEILYGRTAKVFQNRGLPLSYWESDRGRRFFERVFSAMGSVSEGQKPMKKCLSDFIYELGSARDEQIDEWIKRADKEALEHVTEGDWWEISQTVGYIGLFGLLLNRPELLQKLQKCFKKK